MVNHYRWDFIGLSTDEKPTPATSEKVVDGSTFYCSDNSKLYVYCGTQWYEKTAGGGGTYELPIASAETLGGVKIGDNLSINSETGVLAATDTTYSDFTGTDGTAAGTAGLVPAPATTDAGKFLKADGTWDTAGGTTVVQTTGTSTTDVMSQNAVTSMIFYDPSSRTKIQIGDGASATYTEGIAIGAAAKANAGSSAIAIGAASNVSNSSGICIGAGAKAQHAYSVALGYEARTTRNSEIYVGTRITSQGYNNSTYRVIGGVYDGQELHDAATVAQGNTLATSAPTTSTVGVLGQLYTDTTNMHTYQCTAISGDTYTWTQRW